ncbi:MAG: deoxyribose-phosphate aldolase [Bacteroidota bacterium]
MYTLQELAKMIDHSLLHPTMNDSELDKGCEIAIAYEVATVCVKPYYVKRAAELLAGTDIKVCSVIGFPHGNSTIKLKVLETRKACADGATEIDMVVNAGKVLSEDWRYIKSEIYQINKECLKNGAILKVIFENDFITQKSHKIKLCKICSTIGVAFVKTSTGYGYVKKENGDYNYQGATLADVDLMRKNCTPTVQIKGAGGIRNLDDLLLFREHGCTRIGATATIAMLEEAKKRLGMESIEVKSTTVGY